ncbi:hypothetical protein [Paracoccus tegillarcae]|nr:hypothetical protein [Paracoccus tegillarcae]
MTRFEKALAQEGLPLDPRDAQAGLRVFLSLEKAAALLSTAQSKTDAPR